MKITALHEYVHIREDILEREYHDVHVEWLTSREIILCDDKKTKRLVINLESSAERVMIAIHILGATSLDLLLKQMGFDATVELAQLMDFIRNERERLLKEMQDKDQQTRN